MQIVNKARAMGKTTEAIKKAHETGAYMICLDRQEALRLSKQAEDMNMPIRFPVTWEEFLHSGKLKGSHVRNVVIDNADEIFLRMFSGLKIEMITLDIKNER
jgi:hypothetical protein